MVVSGRRQVLAPKTSLVGSACYPANILMICLRALIVFEWFESLAPKTVRRHIPASLKGPSHNVFVQKAIISVELF